MLTACGMFEMDFNKQQEYSYESIIDHMRSLDFKQADLNQLVRRAVFNVLSCNHDDHTKNFSFLMDKEGSWSLSPAYDLTYIHTDDGWNFGQQITINGEYEDITLNDIKAFAAHAGCDNIGDIVDQVREATSNFKIYAEEAEVSTKRSNKIERSIEDIAKNL
jgi:serine/threonine-protein kinase HipA